MGECFSLKIAAAELLEPISLAGTPGATFRDKFVLRKSSAFSSIEHYFSDRLLDRRAKDRLCHDAGAPSLGTVDAHE